jgi:hypothetical protein
MMVLPTPWSKPCHLAVFVVVGLWHDAPLFLCFSGNVAKYVKASPPEFCEDLECLDGLMLVIGRYFAAGSHVCEFLSPLSLFVLWVVSYVFFALSEPLSLGDGEGLRSLWGKLFSLNEIRNQVCSENKKRETKLFVARTSALHCPKNVQCRVHLCWEQYQMTYIETKTTD